MNLIIKFLLITSVLTIDCFNKTNYLIKYLYPTSLNEPFDFNYIIYSTENDLNQTIHLEEDTQVDSFIAYILLKSTSDLNLTLNGQHNEKFLLSKIDFGSTSLIDSTIYPVINLFSLKLAQKLDREVLEIINLTLNTNVSEQSSLLTIIVQDVNDNEPKFLQQNQTYRFFENNKKNICIGKVQALDPDKAENGTVSYYYVNGSLTDPNGNILNDIIFYSNFLINVKTGDICVRSSLDREKYDRYHFKIKASDNGKIVSLESHESVDITLLIADLNDNSPDFFENESKFYINENAEAKTFIAWLKAYDFDSGLNSKIDYYIEKVDSDDYPVFIDEHGVLKSLFQIQRGNLTGLKDGIFSLSRDFFDIKVIAKDRGIDRKLSKEKLVRVFVIKNEIVWDKDRIFELNHESIDLSVGNESGVYDFYPVDSTGLNCEQENLIDYFRLSKNGSLTILNTFSNETICFLNMRKISENKTHLFEVALYQGVNETEIDKFRAQKFSTKRLIKSDSQEKSSFMIMYFFIITSLLLALFGFVIVLVYSSKVKFIKMFLSKKMEPVNSLISYKPKMDSGVKDSTLTQSIESNKQLIDLKKEIDLCNKKLNDFNWSGSSTNSSLLIKDSPRGSSCSEDNNNATKKVSYGIYQVANQIIIDYDDNTSCEVICNKNLLNSSLKRFENIYYSDNGCDNSSFKKPQDKKKCLSSFV